METPWHHLGTSKTTLRQHLEKLGDHMAPFENFMDNTWAPIGNYMKATWRRLLDNLGLRWEKFDATLVKLLTTLGPHRDYWRSAPLPCGQHMATFSVISKKWNKRLEFWRKERRETAKGWAQTQKGNIQLPPKWGNQWKFTYNDIYNLFSISSCHCPLRTLHIRVLAPKSILLSRCFRHSRFPVALSTWVVGCLFLRWQSPKWSRRLRCHLNKIPQHCYLNHVGLQLQLQRDEERQCCASSRLGCWVLDWLVSSLKISQNSSNPDRQCLKIRQSSPNLDPRCLKIIQKSFNLEQKCLKILTDDSSN